MTHVISIRFYEELNDFLPEDKRKKIYQINYLGRQSVKDLIESQGVPHTEVDLVIVNNISVDFNYIINPGDFISVYPIFESIDITKLTKVREKPLRELKFILDVHLGKLAKYLRLLGFDTIYNNNYSDLDVIKISNTEKRIILTRDLSVLKRNDVKYGYWIRSQFSKEQAKEVIMKFDLNSLIAPFKYCLECNGIIEKVEKEKIIAQLLPETQQYFDIFYQCSDCQKVYWEGNHYERMKKIIDEIIK